MGIYFTFVIYREWWSIYSQLAIHLHDSITIPPIHLSNVSQAELVFGILSGTWSLQGSLK